MIFFFPNTTDSAVAAVAIDVLLVKSEEFIFLKKCFNFIFAALESNSLSRTVSKSAHLKRYVRSVVSILKAYHACLFLFSCGNNNNFPRTTSDLKRRNHTRLHISSLPFRLKSGIKLGRHNSKEGLT